MIRRMTGWMAGLLAAGLCSAATTVSVSGPPSIRTGSPAALTVTLAGSAGQGIVVLQWGLALPAGASYGTPVLASRLTGSIVCAASICQLRTTAALTDGTLATIPLTFGGAAGPVSLAVNGISAAQAQGYYVDGVGAGPAYTTYVVALSQVPAAVTGLAARVP
jgi:hypothetical protein